MNLAGLILGVPIFGGATFALWKLTRRLPTGRKGLAAGLGALLVISLIAFGGWLILLCAITTGTYVCTDCGRTERQERFLFLTCSWSLVADGEDYVQRFSKHVDHPHRWHLDSCLHNAAGRVACGEQRIVGWFRVLPQLKDRAAADGLYREAQALPEDRRVGLMQEVSDWVSLRSFQGEDVDRAFDLWRSQRGR